MMQTVMEVALKEKGFKPITPESTPPVASSKPNLVKLKTGSGFVLIFGCASEYVPDGIQVLPAGGGNVQAQQGQEPEGTRRFRTARVDLDGLMARCIVDSINVCRRGDYCRVYVNCTVGSGGEPIGFHFWRGAYEKFVRKAVRGAWKSAVLKPHPDGRTSLEVRNRCQDEAPMIIRFAIED